jgi:predicted nucleic acid-binding protein
MTSGPFYFDACCFIDMAAHGMGIAAKADREPHVFFCRKTLEAARASEASVFTSSLTLMECSFVRDDSQPPGKEIILNDKVKSLLNAMLLSTKGGVMPVQPTPKILRAARELRWAHGITLSAMDALHVATAMEMKCTHFITTDTNFGAENLKKIEGMGLAVCAADSASHLLPHKYGQLPLALAQKPAQSAPPPGI